VNDMSKGSFRIRIQGRISNQIKYFIDNTYLTNFP